jgi:thioredoxin-related protein
MIKLVVLSLLLAMTSAFSNDNVDIDGHVPGRFTMDLEAAKKYASEKGIPLLLNFTGSDWCHWCKMMENGVFNQGEWREYAKDNVVMVWLDFPKDKSLVPQKYVARNNEVRNKYKISGYPSYLLVDAKLDIVIGRLGAGKGKTAASFKAEVSAITTMTESNVKKFADTLGKEKAAEYMKMHKEIKQKEEILQKAKEQYITLVKKSNKRITLLRDEMEETRVVSRLKDEQVSVYLSLRKEFKIASKKLQDFRSLRPESNQENIVRFKLLSKEKKEIQAKLSVFH